MKKRISFLLIIACFVTFNFVPITSEAGYTEQTEAEKLINYIKMNGGKDTDGTYYDYSDEDGGGHFTQIIVTTENNLIFSYELYVYDSSVLLSGKREKVQFMYYTNSADVGNIYYDVHEMRGMDLEYIDSINIYNFDSSYPFYFMMNPRYDYNYGDDIITYLDMDKIDEANETRASEFAKIAFERWDRYLESTGTGVSFNSLGFLKYKSVKQIADEKAEAERKAAEEAAAKAAAEEAAKKEAEEAAKKAAEEAAKKAAEEEAAKKAAEEAAKKAAEEAAQEEAERKEAEEELNRQPEKGDSFDTGNWTYVVTGNKVAKVTLYTGSAKNVKIPATAKYKGVTYKVTAIDKYTFSDSENITTVTIPKGITSIGLGAFDECAKLKSITITADSKTCTKIGKNVFRGIKKGAKFTIKTSKKSVYNKLVKRLQKKSVTPKAVKAKYVWRK